MLARSSLSLALCLLAVAARTRAQTTPPPAASPPAELDLLRVPGAAITVSSCVENPRDLPANLIDGNTDTTWSSRTGQLEGTEIDFQVPTDCTVRTLQLTVGMTSTGPTGDLFTMNPRIAAVDVYREGTLIRNVRLDVNQRALQSLSLGTLGGLYRVVVTRVTPGTRANWREVSVSEFRVLGTCPGVVPSTNDRSPEVRVGTLRPTTLPSEPLQLGASEALPHGCFGWSLRRNSAVCTQGLVGFNLPNGEDRTARWNVVFLPGGASIVVARNRDDVEVHNHPPSAAVRSTLQTRVNADGYVSLRSLLRPLPDGTPFEWTGGTAFRFTHRRVSRGGENSAPTYNETIAVRWRANGPWISLFDHRAQPATTAVSLAVLPGDRFATLHRETEWGDEGVSGTEVQAWRCDRTRQRCQEYPNAAALALERYLRAKTTFWDKPGERSKQVPCTT